MQKHRAGTTEKVGVLESYYSKPIISYPQEGDYNGSFQFCIVLEEVHAFEFINCYINSNFVKQ